MHAANPIHTPANATAARASDVLQRTCACGGSPGPTGECAECRRKRLLQPKLTVNEPGDRYEQEADRVAEAVMRMPDLAGTPTRPGIQRVRPEDDVQRQVEEDEEEEERVQAKEAPGQAPEVTPETAAAIDGLRGGGQPLDRATRAYMEPRFGYDFGQVRIHTDAGAADTARSVQARAFTLGRDVVFGASEYRPGTEAGRRLLAHELTHVVQQRSAPPHQDQGAVSDAPAQAPPAAFSPLAARHTVQAGPIQRFSDTQFGTSPPSGKIEVPKAHRPRVRAAMAILDGLAGDRRCKEFFKDNCTAGLGDTELATALSDVEIYEDPTESEQFGESDTRTAGADPRKIAYNLTAFRIGRWMVASTLLHEMFHTCILGTIPDEEITAETAVEVCRLFTPFILEVSPKSGPVGTLVTIRGFEFGPSQKSVDRVTFNGVDAGTADAWVLSNADAMVRIQIRVPAGATSGPIVVENNGIPSNKVSFTVT